jgi:putative pyruvate formate lyase activating enzyme
MIIHHLVLPGHVGCCTRTVLPWVTENCSRALVNVLGWYHPEYLVLGELDRYPGLAIRPSSAQMEEADAKAAKLGLAYKLVSC